MNRLLHLLVGPEVLWLFFYFMIGWIIQWTHSPVKSMDSFWVNTAFYIPLILIPLTFGLYYAPGVIRNWLLLRIWIVGIIGGHMVLNKSLMAHSEQGPGVGTAYIMGIGLVVVALIAGVFGRRLSFKL